jgi:hypothetical protein
VLAIGGGGVGGEPRLAALVAESTPARTSAGYEPLGAGGGDGDDILPRVPSARGVSPLCAACLQLLRVA